jgi:hypothetical protein
MESTCTSVQLVHSVGCQGDGCSACPGSMMILDTQS